ncbi:MAG: type-4 uracil-DNA glycosylase [Patescibacteria group bacterium]|nr:MAG: type-4 uracil-DNA glycosylase [Patescibacteria group bacterium]
MRKKKELLSQIDRAVRTCHKCRLWRTAIHAVPGEGRVEAKVMFIGEGPGYHEDKLGRPFVGRAGQLLDRLLSRSGMKRADVFITNVVKHRPPENRAPMKDEVRACLPYLLQQIKVINPEVIVPLGRSALEIFIKDTPIGEARGRAYRIGDQIFFPLYHPAAALRSTSVMNILEKDFSDLPKLLRGELDPQELEGKSKDENQLKLI